jgi:NADPH-dependent 2,4-dienoyl-CoA reductase/sulfur reductase-like enzyme
MSYPALSPSAHVVVVGAGLAGWRLCEALRREGFLGEITLLGDEAHAPYDRPPLSKQVLSGKWAAEQTSLVKDDALSSVNFEPNFSAVSLEGTTVTASNGRRVSGDHVVIATGTRARRAPWTARGLYEVRSLDDVAALRAALATVPVGGVVAVIGAGFIGAEVATGLLAMEKTPLVFEAQERPLQSIVGETVARWLEPLASDGGIDLRSSQRISEVSGEPGNFTILFDDGSRVNAGVVVVGIGAQPNVEWLASSGLDLRNGVTVDEFLHASDRVSAIGDVANFRWLRGTFDDNVRIEHWQVANDHATYLAKALTQGIEATGPLTMVPYFWSDQYGKKIQVLGHPHPSDDVVMVTGSFEERKWLALYSQRGLLTGAIALSQPRALMMCRALLESQATLSEAVDNAPWAS